jgi:hypothetical protein
LPYANPLDFVLQDNDNRAMRATLSKVKSLGFRTIVVAMEFTFADIPLLADTAEQLGLNNGNYFWVFLGIMDTSCLHNQENPNITKLLVGSAWLAPVEGYSVDADDPFGKAWKEQGVTAVDRLNVANPVAAGKPQDNRGNFMPNRTFSKLTRLTLEQASCLMRLLRLAAERVWRVLPLVLII